jgi:hypothetical protein
MDRHANVFYTTIAAIILRTAMRWQVHAGLRIVSTDGHLLMASRWWQIGYLMCELECNLRVGASGPHRGSARCIQGRRGSSPFAAVWKLALTHQVGWS